MEFKKSVGILLLLLLVFAVYGATEHRSVQRYNKLTDTVTNLSNAVILLKLDDLKQTNDAVAALQEDNARLRRQVRELWFTDVKSEVAYGIISGQRATCPLLGSSYSVSNAFFDKLPYKPAGYLTYNYRQGWLVFDKQGTAYCFNTTEDAVRCDEMCRGVWDERALMEKIAK